MVKCESCGKLCENCGQKIEHKPYEPNPFSMKMLNYDETFLDVWGFKIVYFFIFFAVVFFVFMLSEGTK